ncbi:MAG: MFS transporter [Pseudomonadota bacterium]|nr:MFS transporter [Pseudomonadota bacterium]
MNTISSIIFFLTNRGMGRALRHRDYAMYAIAGWISNIGLWVQRIAVGWLTWLYTGSWVWLGIIVFAEGVVTTIIMPVAGTYTDRLDRLTLARVSQLGLILISGLLAVLTYLGLTNIWILLVLMMMCGAVEGFWTPVRMSIPPNLVPREDLPSALGISASLFNLAQFVGPAVAAVIIASFDSTNTQFGLAFAFNSFTFSAYLLVLFIIKLGDNQAKEEKTGSFFSDFQDGLSYVRKMPGLILILFLMLSTSLCMRSFRELLPGISDGIFAQGADGLAILTSATGAGAVAGALVVANFNKLKGVVQLMLIFFCIDVLFQLVFAFSQTFILSVICAAGMGFSVTAAGISAKVLVQSAIHDEMRGRVMSLWGIIMRGGVPTGAIILGSIVSLIGFKYGLLTVTVCFVLVLLFVLPRSGVLTERLESPPGDNVETK